jgi:hypothetical protein
MHTDWHQLRHDGLDRHRAFLAEAAQRHRLRQCRQNGHEVAPDLYLPAASPQPDRADATRRPIEEGTDRCALFTEREWQRLTFLRWRYRHGQLCD